MERGESAKTQNRTELQKLIKYAIQNKKKLTALIIWKYDRLARNLSDQMELVKCFSAVGMRVLSATENNEDNSTGRLTRNVIGAFSQFDNDQRSERTKSGMKQALQSGRWCFQAPIGYKFSRDNLSKPILIPSEDAVFVKEAFALFETGLHTQVAISNMLKSKDAKKMSRANLNRLLRQSLYAGIIRVKKWFTDDINGIHEALISKETFFKVQYAG